MQARVKMPRIKISMEGDIDKKVLIVLKKVYGENVEIIDDGDDLIDAFETDWYKKTKSEMHPGKYMKIYRENQKMTQEELGEKLGGISKQNISHMERGVRPISKKTAKILAEIFKVSVERFI